MKGFIKEAEELRAEVEMLRKDNHERRNEIMGLKTHSIQSFSLEDFKENSWLLKQHRHTRMDNFYGLAEFTVSCTS